MVARTVLRAGTAFAMAAAVALSGCGSPPAADTPAVSRAGGSGAPPGAVGAEYNELDVRFVEQMISHHRQAVQLAELAIERAGDEQVLVLAEHVIAVQEPEIAELEAWLSRHGLPIPETTTGHHAHSGMPGMISPFQLQLLEGASGRDFDEKFLTYLSHHNAGAIEMAAPVVTDSSDAAVVEIATEVITTHEAEISRIQDISRDL